LAGARGFRHSLERIMDKLKGERDEYYFMLFAPTDFHYAARFDCRVKPWHIYVIQR